MSSTLVKNLVMRKRCCIVLNCLSNKFLPISPVYKHFSTVLDNNNTTVKNYLHTWKTRFEQSGVSEPKESIEHILAFVLGSKKVTDVYRNQDVVLKSDEIQRLQEFCNKRLQHMPVQYIIQEWDFRDLTLKMSRPVFIPRPETEMLVDLVLNEIERRNKPINTFLELCCGSGAISLALLKSKPQLQAVVVDKSPDACALTRKNAEIHGLSNRIHIFNGQIDAIDGRYDLVVSNPPYVPTGDLDGLQLEIKLYEDRAAQDGGPDGMTMIKRVLNISSRVLNNGGKVFLEVEPSEPKLIKKWLEANTNLGLQYLGSIKDFCNKERYVEILKKES